MLGSRSKSRTFYVFISTVLFLLFINSFNVKHKEIVATNSKWNFLSVHSAVRFEEHVLLLLKKEHSSPPLPSINSIQCIYGVYEKSTALAINEDWTVLCSHPPEKIKKQMIEKIISIEIQGTLILSKAKYPSKSNWMRLVYANVPLNDKILLFAKGIITNTKMKKPTPEILSTVKCVFDEKVETNAIEICQENILCNLPPVEHYERIDGKTLTVKSKNQTFPSVALLDLSLTPETLAKESVQEFDSLSSVPKYKVCACTMVWNVAHHVHEWVSYHSHIGVQHFFFYDNNSDDDLKEVLNGLKGKYNVSRHYWPWMKTQEAGFSHCTIRAQLLCEWVLFTDVDEFLFPVKFIRELKNFDPDVISSGKISIMDSLITDAQLQHPNSKLGNVQIMCQDYGPSGLHNIPKSGQMVNYACRLNKITRHKSLVNLKALAATRCGRIHHFSLKNGYEDVILMKSTAVINHYKYQVWNEFRLKFFHRVATYVKDWNQKIKHSTNNDRVVGLKSGESEPQDWASRFCEMNDTRLKDYVEKMFRNPSNGLLPWE